MDSRFQARKIFKYVRPALFLYDNLQKTFNIYQILNRKSNLVLVDKCHTQYGNRAPIINKLLEKKYFFMYPVVDEKNRFQSLKLPNIEKNI